MKKGARAADYDKAIKWLENAGLVYRVPRLSKAKIHLPLYMDKGAFKLFVLDVGLLGAMARIPPALMLIGDSIFSGYEGGITENYVLTQMIGVPSTVIGYYSKENSTLEIDFIVQTGSVVLPVEVRAEENSKSKSLHRFVTVDNAGRSLKGICFSMKDFEMKPWMLNIPLFSVNSFFEAT